MSEFVDIRVLGLLCSHLCHEIVNPLGAVNNGIELLIDVGDDMHDEALRLVEDSAQRTARRLQFYRMAYGVAGNSALPDLDSVRQLADGLLSEGRLSLEWPDAGRNPALRDGWGRMLLNLAAAAAESAPRGGSLTVSVDENSTPALLTVSVRGDRACIDESTRPVYLGDVPVESLTARNVHGYFTAFLVKSLGGVLKVVEPEDGVVGFEVRAG